MKIWEARLQLRTNEKEHWVTYFKFKSDGDEYHRVNQHYSESKAGWVSNRIPVEMEIGTYYDTLSVRQGFERELTAEELETVKANMTQVLLQRLEQDREVAARAFEEQVVALAGHPIIL